MKIKPYILTFFILFSGLAFSQDAGLKKTSISSSFSPVQIEAYQESANKKIEDFYSYLNLLSDKNTSEKIQTEIRQNIFLLFKNKNVEITDFTSDEKQKVLLSDFLNKLESQKTRFSLTKKETQEPKLFLEYWVSEYWIEVELNGEKSIKKISQKIYFSPIYKKFGNKSKEVWEIKLGEIE